MLSPALPTFLALSQPQPPLLSLHTELLELVVLHFATRPPTQPSANLIHHPCPALDISRRHAETIHRPVQRSLHVRHAPRTAFDQRLAVATLPNGFSYLQAGFSASPGSTPFYVDICVSFFRPIPYSYLPAHHIDVVGCKAGSSSRSCSSSGPTRSSCVAARIFDASLSTRRKIAQIQGVHAADADRMHTDRDLRPLLVEPPRSSSLTPPRTSREELQTTSCTPLRLILSLAATTAES
ncbi:hypothetical protein DFH08DRAFT_1089032 [Mycena albidolilacea]|uniref:Uncharacterized protein n=1 Tax=Mycena albidolilacea TaxID=1033008 RepID=A0AAD7E9N1_9AGAR|nr:hypothetical protein DFH08DRAFT_1089032 [Mycena albidolilacea]